MRRTFTGAVAVAALVVATVPSVARAKAVEVDGNRFTTSGLTKLSQGCVDSRAVPVNPPKLLIERGPKNAPIGTHSSGWAVQNSQFGAGSEVHIDSPSTVSRFRIQLLSPSADARGRAVVRYHPPGDTGYWFGNHDLGADDTKGWHAVNAARATFTWTHFTADGSIDRTGPDGSLADFVPLQGGDGDGAEIGFMFGCNLERFFVDGFEVRSDEDTKTFDFGGFRSRVRLQLGASTPSRKTITYGKRLELGGTLWQKFQDRRIAGVLQFESRRLSASGFRQFAKDKAGRTGKATATVRPARSSAYRIRYTGTRQNEGDLSQVFKVIVQVKVGSRIVDDTITRGQAFTVAGTVKPGKKTGILLQRYVDKKWKTVKRGRTAGDGDYRIGSSPSSAGVSYWRIKAASGGGTAGNVTKTMKLTVRQPSSGGGGGGGGDNPDPDPEEPPPPPPPPEG